MRDEGEHEGALTCAEIGTAEADGGESTSLERHGPHRPDSISRWKQGSMSEASDDAENESNVELMVIQQVNGRDGYGHYRAGEKTTSKHSFRTPYDR